MSITNLGHNRWYVRVRHLVNGKFVNKTQIVEGSRYEARVIDAKFSKELAEGTKRSSLKVRTFGEVLTYYKLNTEADVRKQLSYLGRLERDLGPVPLNELTERFAEYWRLLRDERAKKTGLLLSPLTRNHMLVLGKTALNMCMRRGLIQTNPLACFKKLYADGRDRILTPDETSRIIEVMKQRGSYLLMPFLFSLKNPIRIGDLKRLTRENLDLLKPWIHFYASKTRKRKNRETCLPFLDETVLNWFKALPTECNWLFPRIDKTGRWHQLISFKNHWREILEAARVKDFRWHDIKHCAITWMIDNGYNERDIKNLGVQYSPAMIDRYYHRDASKVLDKWKAGEKNPPMAVENGSFAGKTVNFV
jgi:integrase